MSSNSVSDVNRPADLIPAVYALLTVNVVGLQFSIALSSVAMGCAIALWFVDLGRKRWETFPRTPLDWIFLSYLGAEALATVFSISPADSAVNMKRLLLILNLYIVLSTVTNDARIMKIVGLTVLVASLLTLFEIITIPQIGGHFLRVSVFQYYLTEGGLKMFVLLMAAPFILHHGTPLKWKVFFSASFAILVVGLVITQTRSSWLGFLAGAVTIAILRNRWMLLAIIGLLVLFILFAPPDYKLRAVSMFDPGMKSNLSRIHMLTTGWKMFLDYPVTGTGDIDLRALYETYIVPIDSGEGGHLHNNFMMLLVTLGAVGFVVTTTMFAKIFIVELRASRDTRSHWLYGSITVGSLAAYVGFLVNGLFEWNLGDHEIAVFLWFTVGLALAAQRIAMGGADA
jgi:O-antigen ligase